MRNREDDGVNVAEPAIAEERAPDRLIDGEESLAAALEGLRRADPHVIERMIALAGSPPLRLKTPGFEGLAAIVVSQQVSVASADAIFGRLKGRIAPLTAVSLRAASEEDLRGCGLSAPKIRTLRAIADHIVERGLDLGALGQMPAAGARAALTAVKGVGPWTADIFLLSCLGHPDAWPAGDLALQEAAKMALDLGERPNTRQLEAIGERWRPWRAVAARLLWRYYRVAKSTRIGLAEN